MNWVRGEVIGKGSFSSVYLATPRRDSAETPSLMAVKSVSVSQSSLLQKEKDILTQFEDCPEILRCFGDDFTVEDGKEVYNILLEFASRGNLHQLLKKSDMGLPLSDVRYHTRSILRGLSMIHEKGFVHCDIKLQNILVCGSTEVKIADFGLAKKRNCDFDDGVSGLRGTPLYMSPESVSSNVYETGADIWALGCVVSELVTGKPAWRCRSDTDISGLLYRIGFGEELPVIPDELCDDGKDFLIRCFTRDPMTRWTAEMLLNHPFVTLVDSDASPRSAFDFPEWRSPSLHSRSLTCSEEEWDCSTSESTVERIRQLDTGKLQSWSFTSTWIDVRDA